MGGQTIELEASDGHLLAAYEAVPHAPHHRGGLVIVQEIFGVNPHIRAVADGWAEEGYYCIAPALFDRVKPGTELGYDSAAIETGRGMAQSIGMDAMLRDVEAAIGAAACAGRVGVVGYCLGGSLAWLAATRLRGLAAASCYYGGRIVHSLSETPHCPVQMHFGERDKSIPMSDVATIEAAVDGTAEVFVYPAGHAFNRDGGDNWDPDSARLARERTLALFHAHVG